MSYSSYRINAKTLPRDQLDEWLDGRSIKWLLDKIEMPRRTFYWKMENGFKPEEIERIREVFE